jgi:hypothetical protein
MLLLAQLSGSFEAHKPSLQAKVSNPTQHKGINKKIHLDFVDLEEAYNLVPRKLLWSAVRDTGIPQEMLVVIQKMHAKNEAPVKTRNRISTGLRITKKMLIITRLVQDFLRKCTV